MAVSRETRLLIWSRSGYRCATCQHELFVDEVDTDDPSLVGDIAHIVGEKTKAARGESTLSPQERDLSSNLVLICKEHHKIVDDHEDKYTVAVLHEIKTKHEAAVRDALSGPDKAKQRSIERYAADLEIWAEGADLENWESWTSHMLGSGQPKMSKERSARLQSLREWLFGRVWPEHFPEVRDALETFRRVLADLLSVFGEHVKEAGDWLDTDKFYRNTEPGTKEEQRATRQFEFHVDLVFDLTLKLTRAAEYVCDAVRQSLDPAFRLKEGLLIAQSGPNMHIQFTRHRVQYSVGERSSAPYPGLDGFTSSRKDRDYHWGEGTSIDDPVCRVGGDE